MTNVILNNEYVEKLISFLVNSAVVNIAKDRVIDLQGLHLFFTSIGVSENIHEFWCKEFLADKDITIIDLSTAVRVSEFFIKKYYQWISFTNRLEFKIDINLDGLEK